MKICLIESFPGSGAVYARSPGAWARVVSVERLNAKVVFCGGAVKFINLMCLATVGKVAVGAKSLRFRKAGARR